MEKHPTATEPEFDALVPKESGSSRKVVQGGAHVVTATAVAALGVALGAHHVGDPGTNTVLLAAAQSVLSRLIELLTNRHGREQLKEERDREFFEEMQRHLLELVQSQISVGQSRAVTIEEAVILIEQYRDHAARSAQEERRRLLAAAAAATFRPDLDTEMKSRAERSLAILEPSDIELLRVADEACKSAQKELFHAFWNEQPIASRVSGCIMIQTELQAESGNREHGFYSPPRLRQRVTVTPVGQAVILMLQTYRTSEPSSMTTGADPPI